MFTLYSLLSHRCQYWLSSRKPGVREDKVVKKTTTWLLSLVSFEQSINVSSGFWSLLPPFHNQQVRHSLLTTKSVIYCKLFRYVGVGVGCEQLLWLTRGLGWMMFRGCAAAYVQCTQLNAPPSTSRSSVPISCVESAEKTVSYNWPCGLIPEWLAAWPSFYCSTNDYLVHVRLCAVVVLVHLKSLQTLCSVIMITS